MYLCTISITNIPIFVDTIKYYHKKNTNNNTKHTLAINKNKQHTKYIIKKINKLSFLS